MVINRFQCFKIRTKLISCRWLIMWFAARTTDRPDERRCARLIARKSNALLAPNMLQRNQAYKYHWDTFETLAIFKPNTNQPLNNERILPRLDLLRLEHHEPPDQPDSSNNLHSAWGTSCKRMETLHERVRTKRCNQRANGSRVACCCTGSRKRDLSSNPSSGSWKSSSKGNLTSRKPKSSQGGNAKRMSSKVWVWPFLFAKTNVLFGTCDALVVQ